MAAITTETSQWHAQEQASPKRDVHHSVAEEDEEDDEDDEGDGPGSMFLPIQQHSRPATPADVVFERDVLALPKGKTETELNKHYSLAAQDLGMDSTRRRSRQDYGSDHTQRLSVYDNPLTAASSLRDSVSRTSQSTPPTSCDSSEMQGQQHSRSHYPPSVVTNARPLSSRPPSVLSSKSITSSIRSGFRRISMLSRRNSTKIIDPIPTTESTPSIHNASVVFSSRTRRPSTSQSTVVPQSPTSSAAPSYAAPSLDTYHNNVPSMLSPPGSPHSKRMSRPLSRGQSLPSIASVTSAGTRTTKNFSAPFSSPRAKSSDRRTISSYRPLTPTREEGFSPESELAAAQARTARNRDLQRLRAGQLHEQRRFLTFQREQYDRIRIHHSDRMRAHKKLWRQNELELEQRQADKESDMEQRQLQAELELVRTLEAEKKSVEARLRHMEGYVKGRAGCDTSSIGTALSTDDATSTDSSLPSTQLDGDVGSNRDSGLHLTTNHSLYPARIVSSHSMAMLGQQYRIRSQLPQLHASRINVLREQQANQFARLQARHAVETNALQQEAEDAADEVEGLLRAEEKELRKDFVSRRDRMEWRWKVAESMEKKRLEEERGVPFADLPSVDWSDDAWKGAK